MRKLLVVLAMVVGGPVAAQPSVSPGAGAPQTAPAQAVAASVRVSVQAGRAISGGSGTHLGHGMILTNRHVAEAEGRDARVTFSSGSPFAGRVVAICRYADLALIECPGAKNQPYAEIAETIATRGENVWKIGFPAESGRQLQERAGKIDNRVHVEWGWSNEIYLRCSSGDSGGGIFNRAGRLVGVLWGGEGNSTLACTHRDTKRFWEEYAQRVGLPGKPASPIQPPGTGPPVTILLPTQQNPGMAQPTPWQPTVPNYQPPVRQPPSNSPDLATTLADINRKLDRLLVGAGAPASSPDSPAPDFTAVKKELIDLGFTVELVDGDGKVLQSQKVPLGGVLRLQLVPAKKP